MKTKTRDLRPQPSKAKIKLPQRKEEWTGLLRKAITMAQAGNDSRLVALEHALVNGKAEQQLRKFGIIHEGDLEREFKS